MGEGKGGEGGERGRGRGEEGLCRVFDRRGMERSSRHVAIDTCHFAVHACTTKIFGQEAVHVLE